VLDRIDVHVVHVARAIIVVADQMLPVPPLPDAAFTLVSPAGADGFGAFDGTREAALISIQRVA
jgi:hypothetical protein